MRHCNYLKAACLTALLGLSLSANADERIYWVADQSVITNPAYTYYCTDDMERVAYIWLGWDNDHIVASAEPGAEAGPTGGMYVNYIASDYGYAGVAYTQLENATMDLTSITEDWYFCAWIRSNVQSITLTFTSNNGTKKEVPIELSEEQYPAAKRESLQWQFIQIPMYELFDQGLDYTAPLAGNIAYLNITLGGTIEGQSQCAFDCIYFTSEDGTGLTPALTPVEFHFADGILTLANDKEAVLYDLTGNTILSFCHSVDLSNLNAGMYIIRQGNRSAKLIR